MSTVINIRGTNGSSKTTAVRSLMSHLGLKHKKIQFEGKNAGYQLPTSSGPLFILGSYAGACGGIDRSFSYKNAANDVMDILDDLADRGSALWEGVVQYGWKRLSTFAKAREAKGDRVIFALMDKPLDLCIQHCEARRAGEAAKKGKEVKPLDPANLIGKYEGWISNQNYLKEAGCETLSLSWENPLPTLCEWLKI